MPIKTYRLHYELEAGFIQHWLVLGPCAQQGALPRRPGEAMSDYRKRVLQAQSPAEPVSAEMPTQVDKI